MVAAILAEQELGLTPTIAADRSSVRVTLTPNDYQRFKEHLLPKKIAEPIRHFLDAATCTGFLSEKTYYAVEEVLRDEREAEQQRKKEVQNGADHAEGFINMRVRAILRNEGCKDRAPSFEDIDHALKSIRKYWVPGEVSTHPMPDPELASEMAHHVDTLSLWLGVCMRRIYRSTDKGLGDIFMHNLRNAVEEWEQRKQRTLPLAAPLEEPTDATMKRETAFDLRRGVELLRSYPKLPKCVKKKFTPDQRSLFDYPGQTALIADRLERFIDLRDLTHALREEATHALGPDALRRDYHAPRPGMNGGTGLIRRNGNSDPRSKRELPGGLGDMMYAPDDHGHGR